jgi:multidrug efflux pump subunit AcrA (membrane-fusion protein)
LDRREVKSPIDGVIVERLKSKGEWVQPGETILKIVRLDRLRVEGFVPANLYSPRDIAGAKVVVSVEMPNDQVETATGTIQFVSPVVEASGEYRVWCEVANRRSKDVDGEQHWLFQPGTVAKMELTLKSGAAAATRPVSTKLKFNNK